jgi:branched-chain amino acid transport system ATP-binding protein
LLSEQNLHFAKAVCDRVYVIEKGQIRYSGTMSQLWNDEAVKRNYLSV